jgi:hypothetical protein
LHENAGVNKFANVEGGQVLHQMSQLSEHLSDRTNATAQDTMQVGIV